MKNISRTLNAIAPHAGRSGCVGSETSFDRINKNGKIRTPKGNPVKALETDAEVAAQAQSPRPNPSIPPIEVGRRYDRCR